MLEHFNFRNFSPRLDFVLYADSKLSHIMDLAPDGAIWKAVLEKRGEGYICTIEIKSEAGFFRAVALANDEQTALKRMQHKIMEQFEHWHETRFQGVA